MQFSAVESSQNPPNLSLPPDNAGTKDPMKSDTHVINKYLLAAFGTMRMNEILPAHVRDFLQHRGQNGASAYTLSCCKTVLPAIFTTALNDQIVHLHPCTGVKTPTTPKRPLRIFTPDEFDVLLQELPGPKWRLLARSKQAYVGANLPSCAPATSTPARTG